MTERMSGRADDEATIDVVRYARQLWRDKLLVFAITVACGAIGWGLARMQTPLYVGEARLSVMQAGSAPTADATVKFMGAVQSESVLSASLKRINSERPGVVLTPAELWGRVSSRLGFPPNVLHVEVRWPGDADLPSRLAMIIAEEALAAARVEHLELLASRREVLRTDIEAAAARLKTARDALAQFRQQNQRFLAAISDISDVDRVDYSYIQGEIPAEKARIAALEKDPAAVPPEPDGSPSKRSSDARARLARLEAKTVELSKMQERLQQQARLSPMHASVLQRETELLADVNRAEKAANVFSDSGNQAIAAVLPLLSALEIIRTPHLPARAITAQRTGLARGLAVGLVLSVFFVLTFRAFRPHS